MPINFPLNPTNGQTYTFGARTWQFNGTAWDAVSTTSGPQGITGPQGIQGTIGLQGVTGIQGVIGGYLAITSASEPVSPFDGTIWVDIDANPDQFAGAEDLVNKILMGVI